MPGSSGAIGTTVSLGCAHVTAIMPWLKCDEKFLSLQVVTINMSSISTNIWQGFSVFRNLI